MSSYLYQQKIVARLPILGRNMVISKIDLTAWYCPDCNQYYISVQDYDQIARRGRLMCQMMSEVEYVTFRNSNFKDLSPRSRLNLIGYNVNAQDDYSSKYTQRDRLWGYWRWMYLTDL